MITQKTLVLKFKDAMGNPRNINLTNPKSNLGKADIDSLTSFITTSGIVLGKTGPLTDVVGAYLVTRQVETL